MMKSTLLGEAVLTEITSDTSTEDIIPESNMQMR